MSGKNIIHGFKTDFFFFPNLPVMRAKAIRLAGQNMTPSGRAEVCQQMVVHDWGWELADTGVSIMGKTIGCQ